MNQRSYWEREEWFKPADLIIVGAGIVGASAALFYKEIYPDHEVVIVERGSSPMGASTRNAGFSCIGSISEHLADIELTDIDTVLKRIKRRWNGLQLLKNTMGEEAIGYEHTGGYEVFYEDELFWKCKSEIDSLNKRMEEIVGEKEVYSETIYEGVPAILNRLDGSINSGKLMRSLHQKISELGVRTLWNSEVDSVEEGSVLLKTGDKLKANKIALTVNGFISGLSNVNVFPARGYVFVTQPIDGLKWKGTFNYNEGYVYFRNIDNRLLLGGGRNVAKEEETTSEFGVNAVIKEYLISFANEKLHLPKGWKIDLEWSGIMGMTPDKEPIIKEVKPGVWTGVGLSGMGIAIGMEVARELVTFALMQK
tara:strand:+ start:3185 stop:4282 length:1098 start_codon:yes stop_codon:yes gene_type:complete